MNEQLLIQLVRDTIQMALLLSAPVLLVGLIVGVGISILQVVTSIQDATLSFVPRIAVMVVAGLVLMPWMMERVTAFTIHLFSQFALYAR